MIVLVARITFLFLVGLCTSVQARTHHATRYSHHGHVSSRASLDATCAHAARLGGPCGCFASELLFGRPIRELWLARAWYKFPRTAPHPGAVAVRPHHVAVVIALGSGNTVIVHDSWNSHHVISSRGLTFVEPRGTR